MFAKEIGSCPKDCVEQWGPEMDFVTVWRIGGDGTFNIPTGTGKFLYQVDWDNDGVFDQKDLTASVSHKYPGPSTYTVRIRGTFPHMLSKLEHHCKSETTSHTQHLLEVKQWGNIQWRDMNNMFANQHELIAFPSIGPDLTRVSSMRGMFKGATSFNQPIGAWNTSRVKYMTWMFEGATSFNQPIGTWDTSNVTDMGQMFHKAEAFNQPIGTWDTSFVTNMVGMFYYAEAFNQSLDTWDTSSVEGMELMFGSATSFNQSLGKWNLSKLKQSKDLSLGAMSGALAQFFFKSGMTPANYDATLNGWAANKAMQKNLRLTTDLSYCNSTEARQILIQKLGWSITDKGKECH